MTFLNIVSNHGVTENQREGLAFEVKKEAIGEVILTEKATLERWVFNQTQHPMI